MHILHCSPIGASKLAEFIQRLLQEGAERNEERTALMLPSPYLLEQARLRLKQTALPGWEFPGLFSMDELAAKLSGYRKISRVEQELILEEILVEPQQRDACACFAEIAEFPGFVAALARLFDEFKMAAVTPDELESVMEGLADSGAGDAVRDPAVALLFRRYQEKLIEYALVDIAGTYLLAVEALAKQETKLPFQRLLIAEFSILSPMRLQFIAGLQRRVPVEISIYYEKNRPALYAAVEPVVQSLVGLGFVQQTPMKPSEAEPALQHLQRQLFAERPDISQTAPGLTILLSPTRAKEIALVADQVKSALLSSQLCPSDIALVVREPELYPQIRQSFAERGIPLDAPHSVQLGERACVRLVFAWLELLRCGGGRAEVMAAIKSPYLRAKLQWDADRLEQRLLPAVIRDWDDWTAAIVRQAPDPATTQLWLDCLADIRLQQQQWTDLATAESVFASFRAWVEWLDLPAVLRQHRRDGTLDLAEVRAELLAWQAVLSAFEEMELMFGWLRQGDRTLALNEFSALLRRMLQGITVDLAERQELGVQLVSPGTASGMRFPLVFILGLTEGEFPAQPRESWLYGDGDRRLFGEMGLELSTAVGRGLLEDFYFALAIAMASEKLVLSAVTDSEKLPSRYLNEVTRLFADTAIAVETTGIEQIVAATPEVARSRADLIRGSLRHCWQGTDKTAAWQEIYDALQAGFSTGLTERAIIEANRTDAYAGAVSAELIEPRRFSASALERYATCPFAYFVTDILGLGDWDEADEGLDALSAGAIWHEILAAFMTTRQGEKLKPAEMQRYIDQIMALLDRSVGKKEQQGRLVPGVWWQFERRRWQRAIRLWLEAELNRQDGSLLQPDYFEWGFGMEPGPGSDARSNSQPLIIEQDGKQVELQGKVDRIDVWADSYRVIDYKSGQTPTNRQLLQGVCLQVPVYMMAAESLLGQNFADGIGMYAPVGRDSKEFSLPGKKSSKEELFALTQQYVLQWASEIRAGKFPARPALECASYCLAAAFCRHDRQADSEAAEESTDE